MRALEAIDILCGHGGLNASGSPALVADTDLVAVESLTYENDTWQKDGGATKFNSSAVTGTDPEIRSMHHFRSQSGTHELVVATRKNRLLVVGSGGITKTIYNGSSGISFFHSHFAEGFNGSTKALYHFSGGLYPSVYTGGDVAYHGLGSIIGTVTADSATDTFTRTAHGLSNNERVFFDNAGGALPGDIFSFTAPYWVVNSAANTFKVSLIQAGSPVNITSNGSGTTTVHRQTMPTDWTGLGNYPRWGFMHRGRMFAGGGSEFPYNVYTSVLNNHNDYVNTGALLFSVYPGEGDICIGGISWRNKAYVFKFPSGIYVLDDESTSTSDWGFKRISKYVGAISQSSIVEADDDVYFASPDGYIHALSAVRESGDVRSSAVKALELGPYLRANTDFSKLSTSAWSSFLNYPVPQGVYYPKKKKIYFSFSSSPNVISSQGYPVNKTIIGLDIHRSNARAGVFDAQIFTSTRDEADSLCIYRDPTTGDPTLLAGASNGFIYKLDQSARSKDSAGYTSEFETKTFYPYGNARNANMRELEVTFAPGSSGNSITVHVYQDDLLSTSATLTDASPRMRLYGDCRKFFIVGTNSVNNETFSVSQITVRFVPGNAE